MLVKIFYSLFIIFFLASFSSKVHSANLQTPATPKTKIKVIVFDFGGVFAKTDHFEVAHFIRKSLKISPEEGVELIAQLKDYSQRGKTEEEFWLNYANCKKKKLPENWVEQLNEARFNALKVIPGMIELVKDLQRQGFQTALLSNVRETHAQIKRKLGFYDFFQPLLLSYKIGVSKPDPKAYQILLDEVKMPPDAILFVDNKLTNIEAAKNIGMDAILFVNPSLFIKELKQRGIEVSLPVGLSEAQN